ncbi:MAG: DNA helicase RecQ [Bdellovibrionales bacterium]|nr:DNA helicase RecQ [Bdellovibrionales bacterium]
MDAKSILQNTFGYSTFRGIQEEIISHVGAGKNALVLMPTGAGKSLCYQIPALLRGGTAIVVSPLIALMRDQVEALKQYGICAEALNSSLAPGERAKLVRRIRAGEIQLLYVAPERLLLEETLEMLSHIQLSLFAIDEAHCISQWGHDFRPEYSQLDILIERFPGVPRIALTATADTPTRKEIVARLALGEGSVFATGFDRPNIRYEVTQKDRVFTQLVRFLNEQEEGSSGIVYCLSRKTVDDIAAKLGDDGFTAIPYHAGLDQQIRTQNQDRFLNEEGTIVVATIAFGMGINKPDVRFVAHIDLPKSIEAYYQETGRAGRDGLPARAWMCYGLKDIVQRKQMIDSSESCDQRKQVEHRKLNSLLGYCETAECRRKVLIRYFGEEREAPCCNCDTCLHPVPTREGLHEAQLALSAIYRTGQRFGAGHLIQVLRGGDNERIKRLGHDQLKVYGEGAAFSDNEWHSMLRQLVAAGHVKVDVENYGGLSLAPSAKPILKGEEKISFRIDPRPQTGAAAKTKKRAAIENAFKTDKQRELFNRLKAKRTELAKEQGVPPYVIFHDKTLTEIVLAMPKSKNEFLQISGVGESKLERYGSLFLGLLEETSY